MSVYRQGAGPTEVGQVSELEKVHNGDVTVRKVHIVGYSSGLLKLTHIVDPILTAYYRY